MEAWSCSVYLTMHIWEGLDLVRCFILIVFVVIGSIYVLIDRIKDNIDLTMTVIWNNYLVYDLYENVMMQ